MSKVCNKGCGAEIGFRQEHGRWIPTNADGTDHKTTCSSQRGLVDDRLKRPTRHEISQYKVKRFQECPRAYFYSAVAEVPETFTATPRMESGKLFASCIEFVAVEAWRERQQMPSSVSPDALLSALEVVASRSAFTSEAFALVRDLIPGAAAKVDLSFVIVDSHGPWVERGFELACGGDGVIAGGIFDLVERIPGDVDTIVVTDIKAGEWRDPRPEKSPQVGLYAERAHELWPECRVIVSLNYVGQDAPPDEVPWTPELGANAKALARAVVVKTRSQRDDERAWPASGIASGACSRCPFTARCPDFQERMRSAPAIATAFGTHEPATLEDVAAELYAIEDVATLYANRVKKLRTLAKAWAAEQFGRGEGLAGRFPVRLGGYLKRGYTVAPTYVQTFHVGDPLEKTVTEVPCSDSPAALGSTSTREAVQALVDESFERASERMRVGGSAPPDDADGSGSSPASLPATHETVTASARPALTSSTTETPPTASAPSAGGAPTSTVDRAVELDPEPCENCQHEPPCKSVAYSIDTALPLGNVGHAMLEASANAQGRTLPKGADEDALRTNSCSGSSAIGGRDGTVSSPEAESTPVVSGEVARGNGRAPSLPTLNAALPCGGTHKRHKWARNGDPRCERCGSTDRRNKFKKKDTSGSLSEASSTPGEFGDDPTSPGAPLLAASSIPDPCPSCFGTGRRAGTVCRDCHGASGGGRRDPRIFPLAGVGDPVGDPGV